jgi:hypothetical protein
MLEGGLYSSYESLSKDMECDNDEDEFGQRGSLEDVTWLAEMQYYSCSARPCKRRRHMHRCEERPEYYGKDKYEEGDELWARWIYDSRKGENEEGFGNGQG